MKPIPFRSAALASLTLVLTACAPTTPTFDRHFGETVPALRAQQTRNPDAPIANRNKSVDGIEGRSAREAVDRYYNSFAEPPAQSNVFTIGVGSGSSDAAGGLR